MGSSDAVPSEHNSICDGETVEDVGSASLEYGLRDRSGGTRLCTIKEQRSIQTLNTIPSVWTFQQRLTSLESQINGDGIERSPVQRRRCFSADDIFTRVLGSSSADLPETPRKAEPLYGPPFRRSTPPGYPRWPGERSLHRNNDIRQPPSSWSLIGQWLRNHGQREATRRAGPSGERYWRPPTSAHSTPRFANLTSHPFASAPAGCAPLTEAQRALRYASENHVPVTPMRADAAAFRRTATLPSHIRPRLSSEIHLDGLEARSTANQLGEVPIQQGIKLCRHKIKRLRSAHGISSPVLLAHHGQPASSFDGSSGDMLLRELPPIPLQDRVTFNLPPMNPPSEDTQPRRVGQLQSDSKVPHFSPTTTFINSPADSGLASQTQASHPSPGLIHAATFSTTRTSDTNTTDPAGRA